VPQSLGEHCLFMLFHASILKLAASAFGATQKRPGSAWLK
jgi:hypothetical protein